MTKFIKDCYHDEAEGRRLLCSDDVVVDIEANVEDGPLLANAAAASGGGGGMPSIPSYGGCAEVEDSFIPVQQQHLRSAPTLPKKNIVGLIRRLSSRISFAGKSSSSSSSLSSSSSDLDLDRSKSDGSSTDPDTDTDDEKLSHDIVADSHNNDDSDLAANTTNAGGAAARRKKIVQYIKYTYSFALLTFCIWIIICGIYAVQTPISRSVHWIFAMVMMWVLILWLGQLEGGQGCLVGLQPISASSYVDTHPSTYQCTSMTYKGNNLNRFIVGRQFLVVIVVFLLNLCCSIVEDATVPGFPNVLVEIFLESGMAILIVTVIIGQLAAEVCATGSMLDFINTPVMIVTTWLCLTIEASGLLHAVYLVQHAAEYCSRPPPSSSSNNTTQNNSVDGSHNDDKNMPSSTKERKSTSENGEKQDDVPTKIFFWVRVLISCVLLCYTCGVTLTALMNYQTTMYEGPSSYVSIAILLFLICFLGIMEAMQIALFAVVNLPKMSIDFDRYPNAKINCDLAFKGSNFQAFLIGRQICVTMSMFLLARVTTTCYKPTLGDNDGVGFSSQIEEFFNTGLPGAFITTVVASLAWRIFASCFPMAFMNSAVVYPTIRLCLFLESTGVFSAAWVSAKGLRAILRLQPDEDYIGSLLNSKEISTSSTDEETVSQTSSFSSL